jgi:hypothetical protein
MLGARSASRTDQGVSTDDVTGVEHACPDAVDVRLNGNASAVRISVAADATMSIHFFALLVKEH